ncbi:substrate-binding domain-containing protein [Endozoicomonas sp. SM1973]|uniref:Substrate-binding domain-containing protein n=1 Tax=Spartinivicinus marinus TaxID=2994442 RepID=A0A853IGW4_9GAMM|nr:substrate-binding domain-containing protein [Spartinivicinus marinus]MCX4027706.1 substrate-binding domain-containing protein [Spartinivicinus marinus]NYZ69251.1 substrate-binding domain-containing protein [Spartinivicinus marinus]
MSMKAPNKLIQVLLVYLLCIFVNFAYAKEIITITGSTTVAPIVKASESQFQSQTGISIIIRAKGSSAGIEAVAKGEANIGMASRPLRQSEQQQWPQLKTITLAEDAIVLIVNSKNPISNLTRQQVNELYSGRYNNWEQLDKELNFNLLKNQHIQLISKKEGHGSLSAFLSLFGLSKPNIQGRKMYFKSADASQFSSLGASQVDTAKQAMTLVARLKNSIAYESLGTLETLKTDPLYTQIKILNIDDIKPTVASVTLGEYPIKRSLSLVIDQNKTNPHVTQYLQYMSSPEGKEHITTHGYIAK